MRCDHELIYCKVIQYYRQALFQQCHFAQVVVGTDRFSIAMTTTTLYDHYLTVGYV